MSLQQRIDDDLKQALREGDKHRLSVLRMVKSAIGYAAVENRDGLAEEDVLKVVRKQAKQRQDSAEAYEKAGAFERRDAELSEKAIIEEYLPSQMSDADLEHEVNEVIREMGPLSPQTMGRIIGVAAKKLADHADGGRVAAIVRQKLNQETDA